MKYTYIAIDKEGKRKYGDLEAESVKAAVGTLRGQSLMPVKVENTTHKKQAKINVNDLFGRVTLVEKLNFIKNLSVMLKSGFPVSKALIALAEQTDNPTFKNALSDIASQVQSGQTMAASMQKYPNIFPSMMVSIVKIGEVSGNLEENLKTLGIQMEKDHDLRRKTRGAMIYPSVVISIMMLVVILMFTFVLPKLTEIFEDFDIELPFLTKVIIGMVDFMKAYGIFVLIVFVAAAIGAFIMFKNPKVKKVLDKFILKMPMFGKLIKYSNIARYSRTLASLLKSGMPILEAVKVTGEAMGNNEYKKAVTESEKLIRSGSALSVALGNYPKLFTPLLVNMVAVGEESGSVDTVLNEVATFYEDEVDQAVSNLSSVLEPILMLIIGIGVGVLVIALLMPMYSLTEAI